MTLLGGVEKLCREAETTGGFIEAYYDFLMEEACLGDKIIRLMEAQENQGLMDLAEETSQIWGKIVGLFEQIGELIGDDPFDGKNFVQLLITGLSQMEVGVLPPTSDEVVHGYHAENQKRPGQGCYCHRCQRRSFADPGTSGRSVQCRRTGISRL